MEWWSEETVPVAMTRDEIIRVRSLLSCSGSERDPLCERLAWSETLSYSLMPVRKQAEEIRADLITLARGLAEFAALSAPAQTQPAWKAAKDRMRPTTQHLAKQF